MSETEPAFPSPLGGHAVHPNTPADISTPASLLERVRKLDDVASWNRFVDLYTPVILMWLRKFGVGPGDRADVAQATFAQLVKEIPAFRYDPDRRFRGYLFAVTRSRAIDHLRSSKKAPLPVSEFEREPEASDATGAVADLEYNRHVVGRAAQILAADFDPVTREAFRRYVLEGEDARAVAGSLNVAVSSVYQAKSRVTRRLRDELSGLLD